ncbi:putative atpase aaa+ type core [Diaporthe ampelina]|uniref:Putative atpase aaa+ type core n=1 Tax=Diaporthe ampelina TaxID=1214573 RepID=A0A0G2HAV4_9PEZI|nr:putative atpase aaa+ type core [Diaporthe ampelina]
MAIHGVGGGIPEHGRTPSGDDQKRPKLTENQKIICGPFVRGYALNEKKWLNLCINSLSDISFDELAFSDLRLPEQRKDLLVGLASSQQSCRNDSEDLIERKGRGVLIHLCGPHGVGKTLTAESVAEKLKVPLFTLASGDGDLELYSPDIESRLQGLISMCGRWGAIILLDEADALLEETGRHNLDHKRLVSVFLRVTEHYKGIIFLTTNHVEKLNPAFESRIHISLEYPELDRKCRKGIWQTLLRRHNVAQDAAREKSAPTVAEVPKCTTKRPLSPAPSANPNGNQAAERLHQELTRPHQVSNGEIDKLAELKLNGRQIKKFLRTARLMAIYKEEALQYGHINTAVSVLQQFHKAKEAQDEVYRRAYC